MDKDMERLGKERLKRVRRRRQLATFIISMAVIVLGITAYRLIQPASAADQPAGSKCHFLLYQLLLPTCR